MFNSKILEFVGTEVSEDDDDIGLVSTEAFFRIIHRLQGFAKEYVQARWEEQKSLLTNGNKLRSYWLRAPEPMLKRGVVKPEDFYAPDIFIWLPDEMLGIAIPCPKCRLCDKTCLKDWNNAIRRVIDLDRCYYLIGS